MFLYEEAGVVVTMDCRVRVDAWHNEAAEEDDAGQFYYMPTAARTAAVSRAAVSRAAASSCCARAHGRR